MQTVPTALAAPDAAAFHSSPSPQRPQRDLGLHNLDAQDWHSTPEPQYLQIRQSVGSQPDSRGAKTSFKELIQGVVERAQYTGRDESLASSSRSGRVCPAPRG